jgi:hypothetical protein
LYGVIPEIDIWRAANLMLKDYGEKALQGSPPASRSGCPFVRPVLWHVDKTGCEGPPFSAACPSPTVEKSLANLAETAGLKATKARYSRLRNARPQLLSSHRRQRPIGAGSIMGAPNKEDIGTLLYLISFGIGMAATAGLSMASVSCGLPIRPHQ